MTKKISLLNVRSEFKSINDRSVFNLINYIYVTIEQGKEDKVTLSLLNKIMPTSKKQAKSHAAKIMEFGKVGEQKSITRKDGKVISYEIKPSIDMVLRYFTAEYNKTIPEDKLPKRKAKQATRKTKKDSNKQPKVQSANDMA